MNKPKFRKGDFVRVTKDCIEDKVPMTAGRPVNRPDLPYETYFEENVVYEVKEVAKYGNIRSSEDHWRVIVKGGTQFVHEDCFVEISDLEKSAMHFINNFGDYSLKVIELMENGQHPHYCPTELFDKVKEILKTKEVKIPQSREKENNYKIIVLDDIEYYLVPKQKV